MKLIVWLVLATGLVVFGAQNTQSVTFHFLMWNLGPAPVIFAVFAAAVVGVLLAWIVSAPARFRGMRRRQKLEREVVAAHEAPAAVTRSEEIRPGAGPIETSRPAE
jgi:uncharacterized integral membrane protein